MQLIGWSLSNQYERCRRLHFGALWIVLMTPTKSSAFVLGRHSVLQRKSLCNHTYRNQYTLSALLPGPKGLRQIETHGRPLHSPPVSKIFDLVLPEGRCVGLTFIDHDCQLEDAMQRDSLQAQDHWINDFLHEDEVRYACSMAGASPMNRLSFILGRMAMRTILKDDASNSPILKDAHGRPTLPDGYLGSISHKQTTAVALVAQYDHTDSKMGIGIDLEYVTESKAKIATRVLTKAEMENLGFVNGVSASEEVLLRFSMKESLYKAIHPLLGQYIGFQQVCAQPLSDGSAVVELNFPGCEGFDSVSCHWRRVGDFFLSSTCLTLKEEGRSSPS